MPRQSGSGAPGRRRAVLIGTGNYDQSPELLSLRAPRKDVEALSRVLTQRDECRFDEVTSVIDGEVQKVRVAVNEVFRDAERDDLVLIYYSGHGKLNPDGQLHLCARDTRTDLLPATSYSLRDLRQLIDSHSAVARVIIVLDCCFSGAAREAFMKGDIPSFLRANLGPGKGKYILTSSTEVETSVERKQDEYSLFTKWLVDGLESERADLNGDHVITVEELFQYAKQHVEEEVGGQHPESYGFETSPGDIILYRSKRAAPGATSAPLAPLQLDWFQAVRAQMDQGKIIPFVGSGTYTNDVLSPFALSSSLAQGVGLKLASQESLAVTAEYFERFYQGPHMDAERARSELLDEFRRCLSKQTQDLSPPKTHELMHRMKRPWFIVSTTYDLVLEDSLAKSGVPLVIVAHILRSRDHVHDGKVLVVRHGTAPSAKICLADELVLNEATDCVVYKILGSPFLHDLTDPADGLDTVVLSESDYLTFLGRLDNQHTRVPTSFSLPFRKRKLLFLGYSLDIWHYRLVLQLPVFHGVSFAVRQPTSQMEELFWARLGAGLIHSDPEEFAKTMLASWPEVSRGGV